LQYSQNHTNITTKINLTIVQQCITLIEANDKSGSAFIDL